MNVEILRICAKCGENQSLDNFSFENKLENIRHTRCKNCAREYGKLRSVRLRGIPRIVAPENLKIVAEKICHKCGIVKVATEFHKRRASGDGLQKNCKNCQKNHNIKNCNRSNELRRFNYKNNPETRENIKKSHRKFGNKRFEKIQPKLRHNLRIKLRDVLHGRNKSQSATKLVGCTIEELKIYLESKFKPGMSWENWGRGLDKWHIDHIQPCCSFDLSSSVEQQKCFHFTNLQPLWAYENLDKVKSDKKKSIKFKESQRLEKILV